MGDTVAAQLVGHQTHGLLALRPGELLCEVFLPLIVPRKMA